MFLLHATRREAKRIVQFFGFYFMFMTGIIVKKEKGKKGKERKTREREKKKKEK
jgi:hypothetical protein